MLVLMLDSCFSGEWVAAAQAKGVADVVVQAACGRAQASKDSAFTPTFLSYQVSSILAAAASLHRARTLVLTLLRVCVFSPACASVTPTICLVPRRVPNARESRAWRSCKRSR